LSYNHTNRRRLPPGSCGFQLRMMLKRRPSLTDQAKTHIKQRILNQEFDGDRIPSETELADQLGVSRTTIRDALSRLESEGVVYRKQGAGTFVNTAGLQIKSRLEEIWGYEAVLEDHGYTPATRILEVDQEAANAATAAELSIGAGETLHHVKKLFLADGEPVILTHNYIPSRYIRQPFEPEDLRRPVYRFLQEYGEQNLSYYLSEIVPHIASDDLAQTLHVRPGTPLISFEEIGYNGENLAILKSTSYFRDDLLRLRLIRREASGQ